MTIVISTDSILFGQIENFLFWLFVAMLCYIVLMSVLAGLEAACNKIRLWWGRYR